MAERERDRDRGKRSGFTYTPRSAESIKKRAERKVGRYDSPFLQQFDQFTAKQGENIIRILPPTWDNHEHYGYDVWMHRYVGPDNSNYLCLRMQNKDCPICKASKEARDAGEEEEARQLAASNLVLCWIIDREADDDQPKIFQMGARMDIDIVNMCHSKRTGKVLLIDHPDEGSDIIYRREGQGLKTRYTAQIERDPSHIAESSKVQEDILEYIKEHPIPSTFHFYDADYLERIMSGSVEAKDTDLDREGEEDAETKDRGDREERGRDREERGERRESRDKEERSSRGGREDREEREPRSEKRESRAEKDEDPGDEKEDRGSRRGRDEPERGSRNGRDDEREERRSKPAREERSSRDSEVDEEEEGGDRDRDERRSDRPAPRSFQRGDRERIERER